MKDKRQHTYQINYIFEYKDSQLLDIVMVCMKW